MQNQYNDVDAFSDFSLPPRPLQGFGGTEVGWPSKLEANPARPFRVDNACAGASCVNTKEFSRCPGLSASALNGIGYVEHSLETYPYMASGSIDLIAFSSFNGHGSGIEMGGNDYMGYPNHISSATMDASFQLQTPRMFNNVIDPSLQNSTYQMGLLQFANSSHDDFNMWNAAYEPRFSTQQSGFDIQTTPNEFESWDIRVPNSFDISMLPGYPAPPAQAPVPPAQAPVPPVPAPSFQCTYCTRTFKRDSDRIRHESSNHGVNRALHLCPVLGCPRSQGGGYSRADKVTEHLWKQHANLGYTKRT